MPLGESAGQQHQRILSDQITRRQMPAPFVPWVAEYKAGSGAPPKAHPPAPAKPAPVAKSATASRVTVHTTSSHAASEQLARVNRVRAPVSHKRKFG